MNAIEKAENNPIQYFQNGLNVTYEVMTGRELPSSLRFFSVVERALKPTSQELCDTIEAELGL
jgi:hypothetical protein